MLSKGYCNDVVLNPAEIIRNDHNMKPNQWVNKIDHYLVLCIYEQEKLSKIETKNGMAFHTLPLNQKVDSNTFVIWERTYRESEELFVNLRIKSRNQMIKWIASTIVAYLLNKYDAQLNQTSKRNVITHDSQQIEQYVERMENVIKANTFLSEDAAWEEFCSSFRIHLTEWILEEMERTIGLEKMEAMHNQELNDLFYQMITKNFSSNTIFLSEYITIVNDYTSEWINNIKASMNLNNYSSEDIEALLQISNSSGQQPIPQRKDLLYTLAVDQHLHVMNNAPYQYVREALYKKNFVITSTSPWPTTPLYKGNIEGSVQFRPFQNEKEAIQHQNAYDEAYLQSKSLTDLEVDIFDALCSIFLLKSRYSEDIIEIQFDDLLVIRGLKPKLGGEGRRGGYEQKQREQIMKSLTMIQSLWIELEKATVYEKGKPVQTQLQGRTFLFVTNDRTEYDISMQSTQKKFTFTVDKVFAKYLYGSGRQIALLPIQTLQYNPYRQTWEKRLARYFSWRWRTQARKGDFLQPNKIRTLIEAIGEKVNERAPSRTRDRLEKALDLLLDDGVISAWHYNSWDEAIANNKGWVRIWLNTTISVYPPEIIKEQYRSIEKTKKNTNSVVDYSAVKNKKMKGEFIGEQLRSVRKRLRLSLLQVAEELEISSSYVSNIERGMKEPSVKVQNKIIKWMERFT
ncbi:helix-turn-helix domain-containing protein [Bacillus massiliigorillae]|uniref:helix-turn-helix domain-containing protein n=1 Tax=Bacillus massiliigorillae TaxID=1243664 RepID=UPI00039BBFB2|nr:helix-turn-helix transcriptional regulator [Bacillus massiliigorillae]